MVAATEYGHTKAKGQITSKGLFGILRLFQKNEQTNSYSTVRQKNFFEESGDTKSGFEIILPLTELSNAIFDDRFFFHLHFLFQL